MNLTSPTALFWFLLAIPIVIFYLLKIRLRRVPVSTVMFWNQIYEEKKPRSIWQQLRHLLSLLLQLLFLALLAFALTDPLFFWETSQKRRLIVLLDTSASMQATDVEEGSRLSEAKQDVRQLIRTLRSRDDMALITLGAAPEVVSGITSHHRTLHDALDSITPTDQPTQFQEAITLAQSLIQNHPNGDILLLTDGGNDNFEIVKSTPNLQTKLYGKKNTPNAGITQFQIRRNLIDPIGYEVLVEVINHSNVALETRLELELDTEIVDVIPLKLEPEEKWSQVLNYTADTGGVLNAQLNNEDALASDNHAFAILSTLKPVPVYLVSSGNLYLQQVFNAIPLIDLQVVTQQPETLPPGAVLVFHRTTPKVIPAGNVLVIEPQNSTDYWTLKDKLKSPLIANQERDAQLMAHVRLDNVVLANANGLELHKEAELLATTVEEAPIYFSFESSNQKVVVLNANLDEGDLPLRTAFPILMSNALNWFSGSQTEFLESLASGTVTTLDITALKIDKEIPSSDSETLSESSDLQKSTSTTTPQVERVTKHLTPINLTSPNKTVQKLIAQNNKLLLGPLNQVGIWNIESGQKPNKKSQPENPENGDVPSPTSITQKKSTQIACNLSNSRESNLRVPRIDGEVDSFKQAGFALSPIWFYLILLATIFTCVEWYLYQRRWID